MARVANKYKVTNIVITSEGNKKVTLTPVYTGDPQYTTGSELYANPERSLEIIAKDSNNYYLLDSLYYMDFTVVS